MLIVIYPYSWASNNSIVAVSIALQYNNQTLNRVVAGEYYNLQGDWEHEHKD
jgi:hypothetical protein